MSRALHGTKWSLLDNEITCFWREFFTNELGYLFHSICWILSKWSIKWSAKLMRPSTVLTRGNCENETKQGKCYVRPQAYGLVGCRPYLSFENWEIFQAKRSRFGLQFLGENIPNGWGLVGWLLWRLPRQDARHVKWHKGSWYSVLEKPLTPVSFELIVYRGNPPYGNYFHFQFLIDKTIRKINKVNDFWFVVSYWHKITFWRHGTENWVLT